MKKIDWNSVEEAKSFEKLPAGGYVCGITAVEDKPDKEYLYIEFDIAEGEYKNHFRELYDARNFWGAHFIKSYKKTAQGFFKKMLTAIEKSNQGFAFDNDEKALKRKLVGLVIGYEEYIGIDGSVKQRITVTDFLSIDDVRAGKFTVPPLKKLQAEETVSGNSSDAFGGIEDDDLPFN